MNTPNQELEAEILAEKAGSYFSACKSMVSALEALKKYSGDSVKRSRLLQDAAIKAHAVVIQREAAGLMCSEEFFTDYEITSEVRSNMGRVTKE